MNENTVWEALWKTGVLVLAVSGVYFTAKYFLRQWDKETIRDAKQKIQKRQ